MEIKGGCLCANVRYTAEADPTSATVCHCRDCQKFTGSAFAALVRVPKEALTIEGALKTFTSIGGSGNPILRHFCPECGSSIAEESSMRPDSIILNVGTFDNPTVAKAGREIFRDDALPWIEVHGDISRFAKRAGWYRESFREGNHDRDPQNHHPPRNRALGTRRRSSAANYAGGRNGRHSEPVEDLRPLFESGAMLGECLMPELVKLLDGPAVSYGKGAIVGVAGEMEHGGACVHPMLGKPMRAAIGGGKAVIGSNVKVAAAGALLDVPLGHKDDSWSFPHFDTITVSVADAPRPDEILVADGGRLRNRCGTEPIR